MSARGRKPVRTARAARRAAASDPPTPTDSTPADPASASGTFVALSGLAVAAGSGRPERLRTGLRALPVRTKLLVGHADDPAEADALADAAVHRMLAAPSDTAPSDSGSLGTGLLGTDPLSTGPLGTGRPTAEVLGALRRAPASPPAPATAEVGPAGGEVGGDTERALRSASSSGAPLAPALRRQYEDAFGADFSAVRVHSGQASAELNAALGARAFTLGSDIYFGDRVPGTASAADRHLLAHELAHTLQDGDTAHRAVLRRLAVQITPSRGPREAVPDATGSGEGDSGATGRNDKGKEPVDSVPAGVSVVVEGPAVGEGSVPMEHDAGSTEELYIESVAIIGRPPPLFSASMGDHLTAFVISRKGVENAIVDQPFSVAVRELKEMVTDLVKLPGWDLVANLVPTREEAVEAVGSGSGEADTPMGEDAPGPSDSGPVVVAATPLPAPAPVLDAIPTEDATPIEDAGEQDVEEDIEEDTQQDAVPAGPYRRASHHARFLKAQQALETCQALLDSAGTDDLKIVRLQEYIAAYLELRELVPLSVSNWKGADRSRGGKGDGETSLPGFLADPDETPQPRGQLRRDFLSTIATYRIAQAAVEPNAQALAVLMPGLSAALTADQRTELMTRQHVQSVLTNFPQNFGPLADDILWAEDRARARTEARKAKGRKRKDPKKADEVEEEEVRPRTERENFAIIQNHLTRLVKMRYAEAAAEELAHQQKIIELCRSEDDKPVRDTAVRDSQALSAFLPKKPEAATSSDGESRGTKRNHGSESEVSDEIYGQLSAEEAKRVYTGRDRYQGSRASSSGTADLAVQVLLDDAGAIRGVAVARQGRHTAGAHTTAWMEWCNQLSADIKTKQPDEALAVFKSTTLPRVRKLLQVGLVPPQPASATAEVEMEEDSAVEPPVLAANLAEEEEGEPDVLPTGTMPLVELQHAIAEVLNEVTDAPDSSVLDATDTGGKAESHYRAELRAYEAGNRPQLQPEQLVRYILALCDVGEADQPRAERTVARTLTIAEHDYPTAYAASGIADYELEDLVDRARNSKEGVYESESDAEGESDSEEDRRPRKRQKQNPKKRKPEPRKRQRRRSATGTRK